jgi:hypothetical protein
MYDVYEHYMPPSCGSHTIPTAISAGCGWVEGWATFFSDHVYNDPFYRWPDDGSQDEEGPTWGTPGWDNGDWPEGRVTGAMWDILDSNNEAYWDRESEGFGNIWFTFQHHIDNTFHDFWLSRAADGFDVGNGLSLAALYQNTIDYGFRDPLGNYATLTRPTPPKQSPIPAGSSNNHNFGFNTTTDYWSVVGIRPPQPSGDYDLYLYDDYGLGTFLTDSNIGSGFLDFVAIDSNRRALGDYYPMVYDFANTGTYQIELAQGSNQLPVGVQTITMNAGDVVAVRDILLTAGVPVGIRVVPTNSGQNPEAFLMADDPANSATWVRARSNAVASSTSGGAGAAEGFVYTPTVSEWHGFVLTQVSGSGNYTVYADTSAPTGSISIDGGAAFTSSTAATLALSGSDAQTGIDAMRISTDGAMDTEPWITYATSANVTLPAGDGTKTVLVQYRNNAGLVSSVLSDTIGLDTTAPTLPVLSMDSPFHPAVKFAVSWTSSDAGSGVATYDVRVRSAAYNGAFGSFSNFVTGTALTSKQFTSTPGNTYCFSARARDNLGNLSAYGAETCTAIPVDDANLTIAAKAWTRHTGASGGYYQGTFTSTTIKGGKLTLPVTGAKQLALFATQCPGCGTVTVSIGTTVVGTINLNGPLQVKHHYVLSAFATPMSGKVTIKVTSNGKNVEIDALGVSAV